MSNDQKIWFITGVSSGLGRALAEYVARMGDIVMGTVRKEHQREEFNSLVIGKTFGMRMDVTNSREIEESVTSTLNLHGRIDILVNNAGYGLLGAIEEVDISEAREQMETNFFGLFLMTKAVLPIMRRQRSGHIVQISSAAGFKAAPGMGLYNASKFAVQGFSEALAKEVIPFNIKVTIVEPGPFRTEFSGTSSKRAAKVIDDYSQTSGELIDIIYKYHGKQDGDPRKAAEVISLAVKSNHPPLHLPLGAFAVEEIQSKIQSVEEDISNWKESILGTSFNQ
jgi:short-subunit dehydrogenase